MDLRDHLLLLLQDLDRSLLDLQDRRLRLQDQDHSLLDQVDLWDRSKDRRLLQDRSLLDLRDRRRLRHRVDRDILDHDIGDDTMDIYL